MCVPAENSCEFKHNSESVKEQIDQIKKEASKIGTESKTLKLQIEDLNKTVHKQKAELERIKSDEVKSKLSYTNKENLLKSRLNEIEKELREGQVKSTVFVAELKTRKT